MSRTCFYCGCEAACDRTAGSGRKRTERRRQTSTRRRPDAWRTEWFSADRSQHVSKRRRLLRWLTSALTYLEVSDHTHAERAAAAQHEARSIEKMKTRVAEIDQRLQLLIAHVHRSHTCGTTLESLTYLTGHSRVVFRVWVPKKADTFSMIPNTHLSGATVPVSL